MNNCRCCSNGRHKHICQQSNNYKTHLKQPRPWKHLRTLTHLHTTLCYKDLLTRSFFRCLLALNQLFFSPFWVRVFWVIPSVLCLWVFPVVQVADIISGRLYFTSETDFPTDICVPWTPVCARARVHPFAFMRAMSVHLSVCVGSKIVNVCCQKLVLASPLPPWKVRVLVCGRKPLCSSGSHLSCGMNQCFVPPGADKAPHREMKKERRIKKWEEKIAKVRWIVGECGMWEAIWHRKQVLLTLLEDKVPTHRHMLTGRSDA